MRGKKRPAGSCPPASFIRRGLGRFDSVFHTAAFSFDHDRFAVMKKPIEDGGGPGSFALHA
jgi:hypothetical protein